MFLCPDCRKFFCQCEFTPMSAVAKKLRESNVRFATKVVSVQAGDTVFLETEARLTTNQRILIQQTIRQCVDKDIKVVILEDGMKVSVVASRKPE